MKNLFTSQYTIKHTSQPTRRTNSTKRNRQNQGHPLNCRNSDISVAVRQMRHFCRVCRKTDIFVALRQSATMRQNCLSVRHLRQIRQSAPTIATSGTTNPTIPWWPIPQYFWITDTRDAGTPSNCWTTALWFADKQSRRYSNTIKGSFRLVLPLYRHAFYSTS